MGTCKDKKAVSVKISRLSSTVPAAVIDEGISHDGRHAAVFDFFLTAHGCSRLKDLIIKRFFITGKGSARISRFRLPPLLQERRPVRGQDQRPRFPPGHIDEEFPVRQVAGELQEFFTVL